MNLKEWANQVRGRQALLASSLGVVQPNISQWIAGIKQPAPKMAVAIEQFTNGEVTRKDLRPNDWQQIWPELATHTNTTTAEGQGA